MARKDILISRIVGSQSLSATFTSPVTSIPYLDNCAYQINITTTNSIGTFKVQGSLDYATDGLVVSNSGNWVDLDLGGTGTPSASAANDVIMISMNQVPFRALRIVYTSATAGTGVCDIYFVAKQIGG